MESLNRAPKRPGDRDPCCGSGPTRRDALRLAGLGALGALGAFLPLRVLFGDDGPEPTPTKGPATAESVILLWLGGGPSQLETFDPKPGTAISDGLKAVKTKTPGVLLGEGFEALPEQMDVVSLVRSMSSSEGDHERGTYALKTGYRPEPTVKHPSLGAILCSELGAEGVEIPRHVAIQAGRWPGWGGYLGHGHDPFRVGDPRRPLPDVRSPVADERYERRLADLGVVERAFAQGRAERVKKTGHREMVRRARTMMRSKQLEAFEVQRESAATRAAYGDTPFGRGCLAARRLVEVGARWIEVELGGWDTHVNNKDLTRGPVQTLDRAFAALLKDLRERDRLGRTLVVCMGEFGRTPKINALGGRDHWPHAFSVALAGGPIRGGQVIGETDPKGGRKPKDPRSIADLSATILAACGVDANRELMTPINRPIRLSEGKVMRELFAT